MEEYWWRNNKIVGGFDIGKKRNPSHLSLFAITNNDMELIQVCQRFLDGWEYVKQVDFLAAYVEYFNIDRLYYDNTRGELEERNMPRQCEAIVLGKTTGRKSKGEMELAVNFSKMIEQSRIKLIDDDRYISQITCMSNSLKAPSTSSGHADCYDDKTEVLTKEGWKFFKDLSYDDRIASLNSNNNIEYQKPSNIIIEEYCGKMYNINTTQVNLCVTPEHNLYIKESNSNFKLCFPEEIEGKQIEYKKDAIWKGEEQEFFDFKYFRKGSKKENLIRINMDDFLKFIGYYVSEGTIAHNKKAININQKIGWKADIMNEDLQKLPFYTKKGVDKRYKEDGGTCISSTHLVRWSINELGHKSINKKLPGWVFDLSSRQLKILLDALVLGDGSYTTWTKGTTNGYSTVSKLLADQIQEIALKVGWSANIYISDDNIGRFGHFGKGNYREYTINFIIQKNTPCVNRHKKSDFWSNYSGKIYCCTVLNHIIYVRRNGKPVWSGNSFWSTALAISVYHDYYAPDRKRGTSLLGSLNETLSPTEKSPMFDENRCKSCNKRALEVLEDGRKKCNFCFTVYPKENK